MCPRRASSYRAVAQKLAQLLPTRGEARVVTSARVTGFRSDGSATVVASTQGEFEARQVINCGGLQTDRVSRLGRSRSRRENRSIRGEYYEL
ncbi:MAG: FAD-dependent oxidoreductase [Pirellulaceae bacterium]